MAESHALSCGVEARPRTAVVEPRRASTWRAAATSSFRHSVWL